MAGDVGRIATAVRECDLVVGLHAGRSSTIWTGDGPQRLIGVRTDPTTIVVGVIGRPGVNSIRIVEQVRAAVAGIDPRSIVSVRIEAQDPAF